MQYEQSMALARYLAKQLKLDGKDATESLQADIFASHLDDLTNRMDNPGSAPFCSDSSF